MALPRTIRHGVKDFPSLTAMAAHYGVTVPAIANAIPNGTWRGEKVFYTKEPKERRSAKVYLLESHANWIFQNKPDNSSADEFVAAIINDAIAESA